MAFCYFFVFGVVFEFVYKIAPESITVAPDIEKYLNFVLTMFLAFGVTFEVPIAVLILVRMGVVTIEQLHGHPPLLHRRRVRGRRGRHAARTCSRSCCSRSRCACSTRSGSSRRGCSARRAPRDNEQTLPEAESEQEPGAKRVSAERELDSQSAAQHSFDTRALRSLALLRLRPPADGDAELGFGLIARQP